MFDDFSKRSKAVQAALDLAKDKGWGGVGLSDIAGAANVGLADLRREFTCKSDILRAFQAEVDAEVLAKARVAGEAQSPRYRLFDAIMTRFEVDAALQAGAEAYRRPICAAGPARPRRCSAASLASQYWMLAGAGAKLDGPGGALSRRAHRPSTARCSGSGSTTIRRRSIRPWPLSTSGSARANACSQASRRPAATPAACFAASCRAVGSAAAEVRLRPSPAASGPH